MPWPRKPCHTSPRKGEIWEWGQWHGPAQSPTNPWQIYSGGEDWGLASIQPTGWDEDEDWWGGWPGTGNTACPAWSRRQVTLQQKGVLKGLELSYYDIFYHSTTWNSWLYYWELDLLASSDLWWWCTPPPAQAPGNSRTSQHCILACTAGIVSWYALNWNDLALSLSL